MQYIISYRNRFWSYTIESVMEKVQEPPVTYCCFDTSSNQAGSFPFWDFIKELQGYCFGRNPRRT